MKKIYFLLVLIGVFILSCKKETINNLPMASLSITNAVVGGADVKLGSNSMSVFNNSSYPFAMPVENNGIYIWPVGDSLHPYYQATKFTVEERTSYSLFLAGTPSAVDGILVKNNMTYHADNTCGIRFINLSPNSAAFNITLSTTPTVTVVSNLAYKQYTDFKVYPANTSSSYSFQIRRASDNTLLYTYTPFMWSFANETLVINGLVGGSPSLGVFEVFNDRF